jgi:hypothetical protein
VSWIQEVLLQAATVRAFALAHPDAPVDADAARWEAIVVEVAWRHARELEHVVREQDPAAPAIAPATLRTVGALALLIAP